MTSDTGSRGLKLVVGDGGGRLLDVRCGQCAACQGDRDYWCLEERPSGPTLVELPDVAGPDLVWRWISALAALAVTRRAPSTALLVLADVPAELATRAVAPWHDGPVVVASDARDPEMRRQLAGLSSTGRAPLVLTVTDVRAAVRAVERGGQVCGPDAEVPLPSVTELVQRDVALMAPRSIGALGIGSSWAELGAALTAVLSGDRLAGPIR